MSRWFNIGGPCIAADHYMLPASDRLPDVWSLIRKKQYFVVHAPRQCGKTTAFRALMDEINAKGDMAAMYCSVEAVQTSFPVSMALIGLRNIRDYKMFVRPQNQSTGEASPFNVITKAMTISLFTEEEMRALYRQHTDETGQVFEEAALKKAWDYSRGQPYLVNDQILKYMDGLGVSEGWLVVADADITKPWDGKISTTDMSFGPKTVHLVRC